jgi:predicted N-acyltransferase
VSETGKSARIIRDISQVKAADWGQLDHQDNPFLSHSLLSALERSGSVGPHSGWQPHHLALFEDETLVAFAPTYEKVNSHGEFVFDWAWADAYQRNGLPYYPKLLTAVPYTPVSGPRLLVRKDHPAPARLRKELAELALGFCGDSGFSSWHCNFILPVDDAALASMGLLARRDWQFHWANAGYDSFDGFLARLKSRKRKKIRRERRQVAASGIDVTWKAGDELAPEELEFIHRCYSDTFHNYGNYPALQPEFFVAIARELKRGFQAVIATRQGEPIAMAVFLAGGGRLYGRYWGAVEDVPGLHFELAYYQGIEFCIHNGIEVFESGAQGEHKVGRGFVPTATRSRHYIAHPAFRAAIGQHLEREADWMDEYHEQLRRLDPYRQEGG